MQPAVGRLLVFGSLLSSLGDKRNRLGEGGDRNVLAAKCDGVSAFGVCELPCAGV